MERAHFLTSTVTQPGRHVSGGLSPRPFSHLKAYVTFLAFRDLT